MIRWAIVGTSFISDTMAKAIALSDGSICVAAVGRDTKRLHEFCNRHSIGREYTSVAQAVADDEIDVVYIGAPNHVHHELTIVAANAGKAVLSEKSLTVSMDQTQALMAAVEGRVFFVEGLMYLSHPVIARFVEVLRDGRLGELKAIHASYVADIARFVNPEGKGAIYNLGCYPASLVQLVVTECFGDGAFDEFELSAYGTFSRAGGNVVETAAVAHFLSGIVACVHTAETYGNVSSFVVHGTLGTLSFVSNPWLPSEGVNSFLWSPFNGSAELIEVDSPHDSFSTQVAMVETSIANGQLEATRPSPRLSDSYSVMRFLTEWEIQARRAVQL
jgi:predicted dehydrogenase